MVLDNIIKRSKEIDIDNMYIIIRFRTNIWMDSSSISLFSKKKLIF